MLYWQEYTLIVVLDTLNLKFRCNNSDLSGDVPHLTGVHPTVLIPTEPYLYRASVFSVVTLDALQNHPIPGMEPSVKFNSL